MKIAIGASENSINSPVSPVGARSPYFLIFSDSGELLKVIENPFLMGGGAGLGVASMLAQEGVGVLIAGAFGPNMSMGLSQAGIRMYPVSGISVEQALKSFLNGELSETTGAQQPPSAPGMPSGGGYWPGGFGPGGYGRGFGGGYGRGYGRGYGGGAKRGWFGRWFGRWFGF